ncbi:hypothetical protein FVEG_03211 [Fusarium verticillioides 7600]|uniref:Uncharacterized protein n=1 Tax=Gibberella moniliformis (strain M3125 / FGSC 7600) TaxID=334819 RepID=W7M0B6_GIBM7|nr:hypothetical protein FVEG_03211 [Fusarium verticillioides 7600]EWG41015.1 hypothetical protein FVEG_03211 [Fusarium verticillioides 7600]
MESYCYFALKLNVCLGGVMLVCGLLLERRFGQCE